MTSDSKLRIAIIGGGLAGTTLMSALLNHSHLSPEIFESAPEFSERGAAVGIAQNGQAALAELGPEMAGALDRAGAVVMTSSRVRMASGPHTGDLAFDLAGQQRGKVVHRKALLNELLAPIPKSLMHTNKKVTNIESVNEDSTTSPLKIHFQDGSFHHTDAVIGADGVHGYVRSHILGSSHPALKPRFGGFWDSRSLIPIEKAKELLGEKYFIEGDQRQHGWIGNGGFFMHDVLDGGKTVQCVACAQTDEEWGEDEWRRDLDREKLESTFSAWTESDIKRGMIECMLQNPDLKAFAEWHHKINAPTYAKGRVVIIGDAAHAMTPWQGSGAGQAIEDAMILDALLGEVKEPQRLEAAFKAYDQVRRPRTQRIVASSHEVGMILCGRGPDGLEVEKIAELPPRWVFIHTQNQKGHKGEALEAMRSMV